MAGLWDLLVGFAYDCGEHAKFSTGLYNFGYSGSQFKAWLESPCPRTLSRHFLLKAYSCHPFGKVSTLRHMGHTIDSSFCSTLCRLNWAPHALFGQ